MSGNKLEIATFGGGCFWCIEAVFQRVKGVKSVVSGYSGGNMPDPTYRDVCTNTTGHVESIQIKFDPKIVTYDEIIDMFWKSHDPTSLNKQGADEGSQYRSIIFYHDEKQKKTAEKSMARMQKEFDKPIVTEIVHFKKFYKAEEHHQDYYNRNKLAPYCMLVIRPKLKKMKLNYWL